MGKIKNAGAAFKYFLDKYNDYSGVKYPLPESSKGKEAGIMSRLYKVYGDKIVGLIDQFFLSNDRFISSTGRSISVFSAVIPTLIKEIKQKDKPRGFSGAGAESLSSIAKALKARGVGGTAELGV